MELGAATSDDTAQAGPQQRLVVAGNLQSVCRSRWCGAGAIPAANALSAPRGGGMGMPFSPATGGSGGRLLGQELLPVGGSDDALVMGGLRGVEQFEHEAAVHPDLDQIEIAAAA